MNLHFYIDWSAQHKGWHKIGTWEMSVVLSGIVYLSMSDPVPKSWWVELMDGKKKGGGEWKRYLSNGWRKKQ